MPITRLKRGLALRGAAVVAAAALIAVTAGCSAAGSSASSTGTAAASSKATLTVYTDQHPELIQALTKAYTAKTGIQFRIQNGATVGQVQAEGKASPADVFLSEDPGPVAQLGKAGLLDKVPAAALKQVRPGLSSENDEWVAYAARTRVLYYNPSEISEADLPKTLLDIVQPQYAGKFAWAPSGAFVATVQYLISTIGEQKTEDFLTAVKKDGVNEHSNGNVRDTVEAGKHPMGLSNHYYWWIKAAEVGGPDHMKSKIYHFPEVDPGNLILASGAAVLKNSKHQAEADKFLVWLTSATGGQKIFTTGSIDQSGAQYPVALGTKSDIVGSLDDIKAPSYDPDIFADQSQAVNLLKKLGMSE